jgi:flavin-dependent dehydrogenase
LAKKSLANGAKHYLGYELVDIDFSGVKSEIVVKKVFVKNKFNSDELVISPKVLIAADGSFSVVSKKLGLYNPKKGETGYAYSFELSNLKLNDSKVEQIFIGGFAEGGYGYIFPKSKSVANVGIGCTFKKKKLSTMFNEFISLPYVARQVKNYAIVKDKTKDVVWGDVVDKMRFGNVIFCGDAANHNLKPFLEGILPGLISGYSAGNLSKLYLANSDIDLDFIDLMDKKYVDIWNYSKEIQKISLDIFLLKEEEKRHFLFFLLISQILDLDGVRRLIKMDCKHVKNFVKSQNLKKVKEELKK